MKIYQLSDRLYAVALDEAETEALDFCADLEETTPKELLSTELEGWMRVQFDTVIRGTIEHMHDAVGGAAEEINAGEPGSVARRRGHLGTAEMGGEA